jgi:hypothetical protein
MGVARKPETFSGEMKHSGKELLGPQYVRAGYVVGGRWVQMFFPTYRLRPTTCRLPFTSIPFGREET